MMHRMFSPNHRKGSTLIELVLSLTAGSAVMLLAISLVHQTISVTEIAKHRSDDSRTLDRLAQSFRRDVHLASKVDLADADTLVIESFEGSIVTYNVRGRTIVRERETGKDGKEFERFSLGRNESLRLELLAAPDRARLVVQSDTGIPKRPYKPDLIAEAMVGRWKALEQSAKEAP